LLGSSKPKGINKIDKIVQGQSCLSLLHYIFLYLGTLNFEHKYKFKKNHVITEALTTGRMITYGLIIHLQRHRPIDSINRAQILIFVQRKRVFIYIFVEFVIIYGCCFCIVSAKFRTWNMHMKSYFLTASVL
jgi:hypothetical protein